MDSRKKITQTMIIKSIAIIIAYICGILMKYHINIHIFGFIRALIYLGIFILWNMRIMRIVQQQTTRTYLMISGKLMIFWIFIRTVKYEFTLPAVGERFCWYLYYLPMLLIPVFALLTAFTIGKPYNERLGYKPLFLWIISGFFFAIVLTNDFHQLVFIFPDNIPLALYSDRSYSYGPFYFAIVGWMAACAVVALVVMYSKCRIPNAKKYLLLAFLPVGLALIYTVAYCAGFSWLRFWLGDITVVHSLLFASTFEACIFLGMIRSNTRYADLFEVSADCSVQIVDQNFDVQYSASGVHPVKKQQMKAALKNPLLLSDGKVLHAMPISGGYAIWTEDNSNLLAKEEELKEVKKEWQERNDLLQSKYEIEEKHRKILEQNRLYDLLQAVTQRQIDKIDLLLQLYQQEKNPTNAKLILAKIAVLCSYIKRRKHLELIGDRDHVMYYQELKMAFSESLQNLELLGVDHSLFVDTNRYLNSSNAIRFYEFFEDILEADIEHLHSLNIRAVSKNDGLRLVITAECDSDLSILHDRYPDAQFDNYNGEQTCLLIIQTGGAEQ